jgi:hypothetical protein
MGLFQAIVAERVRGNKPQVRNQRLRLSHHGPVVGDDAAR